MEIPEPGYVAEVGDGFVAVVVVGTVHAKLAELGTRDRASGRWTIPFQGRKELARVLGDLRKWKFLFAYWEHGWPPGAVFEQLREEGFLAGGYQSLTWLGGGQIRIRLR
jgi:hypothetical protein